jgi:hypothetical protein
LLKQIQSAGLTVASLAALRHLLGWVVNFIVYARYPRALKHYWLELRTLPNVALPRTYYEKMFWRRVFDHNPAFLIFSDKLCTKDIFASFGSDIRVPETLWVGNDPARLPAELRRPDVVAKMNTGVGRNWFFAERPDGERFLAAFRKWLEHPPTKTLAEWAYGLVDPVMFAERLVVERDEKLEELKVHLFAGEVFYTVVYVDEKRPGTKSAIFDTDGRRLKVTTSLVERNPGAALPTDYRLPERYADALQLARSIAAGLDYARVDFMVAHGRLYSGEVTIYPTAGLMTNSDPAVMAEMSRRWNLRQSWFVSAPQRGWRRHYQRLLRAELAAREQRGEEPVAAAVRSSAASAGAAAGPPRDARSAAKLGGIALNR